MASVADLGSAFMAAPQVFSTSELGTVAKAGGHCLAVPLPKTKLGFRPGGQDSRTICVTVSPVSPYALILLSLRLSR